MRLHLTIHIHHVNDWLELIFCGVLSEWPHKVPQLFGCNKSTVVLVEVLKSIPVICKKSLTLTGRISYVQIRCR